ncbi:DNA polymerase kappa [Cucumispora dikerogammari]|nr:DNA polymerase kappa [Cucumispora dikerogammari]
MNFVPTYSDVNYNEENNLTKDIKRYSKSKQIKEKVHKILNCRNQIQKVMSQTNIKKHTEDLKKMFPSVFGGPIVEIWVHFDLDAFYASVEALYSPNINLIPVGIGNKYMLTTCNYEARKYKIKSGMRGFDALKLCPNLKIIPNDLPKYKLHSEKVMTILALFDTKLEIYGMDEAYLSFKEDNFEISKKYFNFPKEFSFTVSNIEILVDKIRQLIYEKTKLTISAGISVSRGLAKFCTSVNKPNGQFCLKENFHDFIKNKPVNKLNGIGSNTAESLDESFGIKTIDDLKEKMWLIFLILPIKTSLFFLKLSFGFSCFDFKNEQKKSANKSISASHSFKPTNDSQIILAKIFMFCQTLCAKLKNREGSTIHLSLRYKNQSPFNKQMKLQKYINSVKDIFETTMSIFQINHPEIFSDNLVVLNGLIGSIGIKISDCRKQQKFGFLIFLENLKNSKNINNNYLNKCFRCPICGFLFDSIHDLPVSIHVNDCLDKQEVDVTRKDLIKKADISSEKRLINNSAESIEFLKKKENFFKSFQLRKRLKVKENKKPVNTLLKYFIKKS